MTSLRPDCLLVREKSQLYMCRCVRNDTWMRGASHLFTMLLGRMLTCVCRVSCERIAAWACQTHSLETPGSTASSINASTLPAWQMA